MNRRTWFAPIFVMILCLLTSGCISIEQEIFLEPDGSGDLVIHISIPDIPEAMKKNAPPTPQDPQKLIDELKLKIANELPPTIKLKDAKEIRRNGAIAYYMVVHFNRLDDVNSMLGKFSQETLSKKDQAQTPASLWNVRMEKAGDLTAITQNFYTDMVEVMGTDKPSGKEIVGVVTEVKTTPEPAPKPAAPKEENHFETMGNPGMNGLLDEKTMNMIVSSLFKLRFILHTPKKIAETNADIVLNGNTAVWNATFGAFAKEKKPIEMKVTY
jgi:hypothetical protein